MRMAGIDHNTPLQIREKLAFTKSEVQKVLRYYANMGIGVIIVSTCNRTELWCEDEDAAALLLECKQLNNAPLHMLEDEEAMRHLFRVAVGLESKLVGEDQILGQIKEALQMAQQENASTPVLNQMFRCAISAAKEAKATLRLCGTPDNAPQMVAIMAKKHFKTLKEMQALVIGNGFMGRMTAQALNREGAHVLMTQRSLAHGRNKMIHIPEATYIDFDERYTAIINSPLIVSATASPHYTLICEQYSALPKRERLLFDLAVPRDIDAAIGDLEGTTLFDIDDIGAGEPQGEKEAMDIWTKYKARFDNWLSGRLAHQNNVTINQGAG